MGRGGQPLSQNPAARSGERECQQQSHLWCRLGVGHFHITEYLAADHSGGSSTNRSSKSLYSSGASRSSTSGGSASPARAGMLQMCPRRGMPQAEQLFAFACRCRRCQRCRPSTRWSRLRQEGAERPSRRPIACHEAPSARSCRSARVSAASHARAESCLIAAPRRPRRRSAPWRTRR